MQVKKLRMGRIPVGKGRDLERDPRKLPEEEGSQLPHPLLEAPSGQRPGGGSGWRSGWSWGPIGCPEAPRE